MSDFAKLWHRTWNDRDFTSLTEAAQRMYFVLLSSPSRDNAGLVPLTIRRWLGYSADSTEESIRAALSELVAHGFVVIDWDTEEVLIRTFIRNDEVYRQPNVMKSALKAANDIRSAALRIVLHDELLKLPDHKNIRDTRQVAEALVKGLSEPFAEPFGEPFGEPLREPRVVVGYLGDQRVQRQPQRQRQRQQHPQRGRARDFTEQVNGHPANLPAVAPEQQRGEIATSAGDLVRKALPRNKYQPATLTDLRLRVGQLLSEGNDEEVVEEALRIWDGRDGGPGLLPHLLADAAKNLQPSTGGRTLSGIDQKVAGWQSLKETR